MNITSYGTSLDPEAGGGRWGRDTDSPSLWLAWGRGLEDISPGATARGWFQWLSLTAWGAGRVWGLCLWAWAEESEGKADVMGMHLMGESLGVSC